MIFRNSKTITIFIRTFCYILLFFFRILRLNFSLFPIIFFWRHKMRIDDEEYSIEYLRKAIRLYKDFETGALAKLLEEGMKK